MSKHTWQPDPTGRHELRLHDGKKWTNQVLDDGVGGRDSFTGDGRTPSTAVAAKTATVPVVYDISLVGVVLAGAGALALVISVFLPQLERTDSVLGGVSSNTMLQNGEGWYFIALGIAIAVATYRSWQQGQRSWTILVLAVIAGALAAYLGIDREELTIYPIGTDGQPDTAQAGTLTKPGVGIYVAGVGAALALVGGWTMRSDSRPLRRDSRTTARAVAAPAKLENPTTISGHDDDVRATKQCPDCAELVLAEARVCRYCSHRFEPTIE